MLTDESIIELFLARSEKAIAETDKKYGAYCRTMTYNILNSREDSEECVNDTYLKVWNTIPPQRPSRLGAFVARIARNLAFDLRKSRNTLSRGGDFESVSFDEVAECLPDRADLEGCADSREAVRAVERFVMSLSRKKQKLFMLRYFHMYTCAQIAAELDMTEGNVKVTLQRIREKLRGYLEREGIDI